MDPIKTMWSLCILLGTALCVASYTDLHETLSHGRQLKIYLPKTAEKLEFRPLDEPMKIYEYWDKKGFRAKKGRVSGTGTDRRWYLDKVTFDDQGTYTQRDFWNRELSVLKVAVTVRRGYLKKVAGESLTIPLEGIDISYAQLSFSGESVNVTLVQHGAPIAQDHPDYWNRVKTHSTNIELENVNLTDVGYYTLKDQRGRTISINRLELVDHHEGFEGNPLMALLLLLGIPAGICCCCRKKIFKKKAAHTATIQGTTEHQNPPASQPPGYQTPGGGISPGPTGPAQVHPPPNPGYQGQPQWTGPPSGPPAPVFNPGYPPPQNPLYPPVGPSMVPAQPPQWNGPPNQYNPGAAMGYAPVMYSAPPPTAGEPVKEDIKMENMSAADPLLATSPVAPAPTAGDAYQFQVDTGKNTTNFL